MGRAATTAMRLGSLGAWTQGRPRSSANPGQCGHNAVGVGVVESSACGWMWKIDSRRDAEVQGKWVFQPSSASHQTVLPFTVAHASESLSLSASLPLCARSLLHGYG